MLYLARRTGMSFVVSAGCFKVWKAIVPTGSGPSTENSSARL